LHAPDQDSWRDLVLLREVSNLGGAAELHLPQEHPSVKWDELVSRETISLVFAPVFLFNQLNENAGTGI